MPAAPELRRPCAHCRHTWSFHGKGKTGCKAMGCKAGPKGAPCPKFVPADLPEPSLSATA